MDIEKILRGRENRGSRVDRPFKNFATGMQQCIDAGDRIIHDQVHEKHSLLLERAVVITAVTSIEVYFRDILDYIFRYCSIEFFEPKLKKLHADKYDITELVDLYRHQIHPLELVSSSQSFQSAEKIEKVFSLFLGKSLWGELLKLQVRVKDSLDNVASWSLEDLEGLKNTFKLRHELVHDPARRKYLNRDLVEDLGKAFFVVFGCDVLLGTLLENNKAADVQDDTRT